MNKKKIFITVFIIAFGVIFRIFLNEKIGIPNFESVTALSLVSGSFLGGIFGPLIALLTIFISDIYFTNSSVYLFTWSAFILIGILGILIKKNTRHYFLKITGLGTLSVLFFYIWINFGWWLTSGMYALTLKGLIESYIAALPFLRNQLFSSLIFVPAFSLVFFLIFDRALLVKKLTKQKKEAEQSYSLITK